MIEKLKKRLSDKWPGWKQRAMLWVAQIGAKSLDKKGFNNLSAIGGDGQRICFRRIEVDECVRRWARRSKLDARFF